MDLEKRARHQSFKVIISEIVMVLTVIITVIVLAFLVSGYWVGSGFKVERQGMLQIHSTPTGANVAIDDEAPWYQRTNTSKVLSSGEHEIVLTKDGYDSWSKTVNINEGLLYRIQYPRLFLTDRKKTTVFDASTYDMATISPDHNSMLLINNTTIWTLINLNRNDIAGSVLPIDVSAIFNSVSKVENATNGLFTGQIVSANWSNDNEHILFEISGDHHEWAILNVRNLKNSINLTREFDTDFDEVKIANSSAGILFVLRNGKLHKINTFDRQISAIIADNVKSYDFYESDLIYFSGNEIFVSRQNDENTTVLTEVSENSKVLISKFYDEKYNIVIEKNNVKLFKHNNRETLFEKEINFIPTTVKVGHGGEFIFMQNGANVVVLDMEIMDLKQWQLDSTNYGWLDGSMLYAILDGDLIVYDFDGLNRRELSENVSAHFPVTITDNKWLYYFSDNYLIRETIAQ